MGLQPKVLRHLQQRRRPILLTILEIQRRFPPPGTTNWVQSVIQTKYPGTERKARSFLLGVFNISFEKGF